MSTDVAPGQRWAIRDDRYEGWRYVTVLAADEHFVTIKGPRRKGRIRASRFGGSRYTFCGHNGPGILPPYTKPSLYGCGNGPLNPQTAPLSMQITPGFGMAEVRRDDAVIWAATESAKTIGHFELRARETPGDWRIWINRPMSEVLYQRQGQDNWVLVAIGYGFA